MPLGMPTPSDTSSGSGVTQMTLPVTTKSARPISLMPVAVIDVVPESEEVLSSPRPSFSHNSPPSVRHAKPNTEDPLVPLSPRRQVLNQMDGVSIQHHPTALQQLFIPPSAAEDRAAAAAAASSSQFSKSLTLPARLRGDDKSSSGSLPSLLSPLSLAPRQGDVEEERIQRSSSMSFPRTSSAPTDSAQPKKGTLGRSRAATFSGRQKLAENE